MTRSLPAVLSLTVLFTSLLSTSPDARALTLGDVAQMLKAGLDTDEVAAQVVAEWSESPSLHSLTQPQVDHLKSLGATNTLVSLLLMGPSAQEYAAYDVEPPAQTASVVASTAPPRPAPPGAAPNAPEQELHPRFIVTADANLMLRWMLVNDGAAGNFRLGPGGQFMARLIGPLTVGIDFAVGFNLETEPNSDQSGNIVTGTADAVSAGLDALGVSSSSSTYIRELYFIAPTIGVFLPTNAANTAYIDISLQPGIVIGHVDGEDEVHPAIGLRVQDHRLLTPHPTVSLTYGSDFIIFENNFGSKRGWDIQAFINVGLSGLF